MYDYYEDMVERERRHFDWVPVNDKRIAMLRSLRDTCKDCVMCELGRGIKVVQGERIDPHVFSTMNFSKFMVVGQNPGFNECKQDQPFVGPAGENFNSEIVKHDLTRKDFYITNIAKCHTDGNQKPSTTTIKRCAAFLQMEINIMMPLFVITLGAPSFGYLCPDAIYDKALGKMTPSKIIEKKVFAIYHPSPLNLNVEARRRAFEKQIATLCKLVKHFTQKEQEHS
jgi:DNA polymerase